MLLVGVVVLGIAGWWFFSGEEEKPQFQMRQSTADVKREDLVQSVAAVGTIQPSVAVEVKSKASGQIIQFAPEEGDLLEAGATLVKLDPVDEKRNLEQAQISVEQLTARLEIAKIDLKIQEAEYAKSTETSKSEVDASRANLDVLKKRFERIQSLFDKKLVSESEVESAELEYRNALDRNIRAGASARLNDEMKLTIDRKGEEIKQIEADLGQSRIALEEAQERLDETEIAAPIRATLLRKEAQLGQIVSSGISSASGGTTIAVLADLSTLYVNALVDEAEIGRIQPGDPVTITVDAYRGKEIPAVVDRILPEGQNESNVVAFNVRIALNTRQITDRFPDVTLLPNMTANVSIEVDRKKDVLTVPAEAVSYLDLKPYVYIKGDGEPEKVEVTVGMENGIRTEILSGVAEGQSVLTSGFPHLMEAMGEGGPGGGRGGRGRR
jgi:HlyD family secretion protein